MAFAFLTSFSAIASNLDELEEHPFVTSPKIDSDGTYGKSFFGEFPKDMFDSIISFLDQDSFKSLRITCKETLKTTSDSLSLKKGKAQFVIRNKEDLESFSAMLNAQPEYLDIPVIIQDRHITDAGLAHLSNATTVTLSGCYLITFDAKQELRNRGITVID